MTEVTVKKTETACPSCSGALFGFVHYCPYCGTEIKKPLSSSIESVATSAEAIKTEVHVEKTTSQTKVQTAWDVVGALPEKNGEHISDVLNPADKSSSNRVQKTEFVSELPPVRPETSNKGLIYLVTCVLIIAGVWGFYTFKSGPDLRALCKDGQSAFDQRDFQSSKLTADTILKLNPKEGCAIQLKELSAAALKKNKNKITTSPIVEQNLPPTLPEPRPQVPPPPQLQAPVLVIPAPVKPIEKPQVDPDKIIAERIAAIQREDKLRQLNTHLDAIPGLLASGKGATAEDRVKQALAIDPNSTRALELKARIDRERKKAEDEAFK